MCLLFAIIHRSSDVDFSTCGTMVLKVLDFGAFFIHIFGLGMLNLYNKEKYHLTLFSSINKMVKD